MSADDPIPYDTAIRMIRQRKDWRARANALLDLERRYVRGKNSRRSHLLQRIGEDTDLSRSSLAGMLSLAEWISETYPEGIAPEGPAYPMFHAAELRRLHEWEPRAADRYAQRVFEGRLTPQQVQDLHPERFVRQSHAPFRRPCVAGDGTVRNLVLRQVKHLLKQWGEHVTEGTPDGFRPRLCDLVSDHPGGERRLVRLSLSLGSNSSDPVLEILGLALVLARHGRPLLVLSERLQAVAREANKEIRTYEVEATLLLARYNLAAHSEGLAPVEILDLEGTLLFP